MALPVLAAENYPVHRTLSDFRALLLQELADLFVQVVRRCDRQHSCSHGSLMSPAA